jgi:outer membrane receptor protein involved in Fe transport
MTLSKSTTVLGAQGNNHRDEKRHYPVAAAFLEFKLPILNNLNADIVGRYEKFYSDVTDIDNDVFVPALALKWDITDWVSLRTSYGETFSQVNPPKADLPVPSNQVAATTVAYTSFNYPNLDVQPESGKNFSVGFIFRAGDLNVTLDYNAITIQNYTRTLAPGTVVNAALLPGESPNNVAALLDCNNPLLTQAIPGLGNKPYIQLNGNGTCTPGQSRLNSVAGPGTGNGLVGGFVNIFGQQGQVNSGELISNALDVSFTYSINALGGRFMPSLNGTYVTKYHFDDFVVAGVKLADGYNGVGYTNTSNGRLLQGVPEYRLNFGLLYTRDKHTVNLTARYIPSVINDNAADFSASLGRNANIGPTPALACPSQTITTHVGHVPISHTTDGSAGYVAERG